MGYVSTVMNTLKAAGMRTEKAYPGRRMPSITQCVAAVMLEQVDYGEETTVVLVTILSPGSQGGAVCEAAAEKAGQALATLGGFCVQDNCQFDSQGDYYFVPIRVRFVTTVQIEPAFTVRQGNIVLKSAVGFTARREADLKNEIPLANAAWEIQLEEVFEPGQGEQTSSDDPFTLTVTRAANVEVFGNCTWTSVRRENSLTQLRQIRIGTAGSRTLTAK